MGSGDEFQIKDIDGRHVSFERETADHQPSSGKSTWDYIKAGAGVLATGIALFAGAQSLPQESSRQTTNSAPESAKPVQTMDKTGGEALQGHHITGIRSNYTGQRGLFDGGQPDFEDALRDVWKKKERLASNQEALDHVVETQVDQYDQRRAEKSSLDAYLHELHNDFDAVRSATDWETVGSLQGLSDKETAVVRSALGDITAETLGSYAMTELFPDTPGRMDPVAGKGRVRQRRFAAQKNEAVFDYVLRNAGEKYLELQPALFDEYCSFGPFQHTSYVIRNDNGVTASANLVNRYVDEAYHVPGSMQLVKGDDHVNGVYGLLNTEFSRLLRGGGENIRVALDNANPRELSMIAAGLHHAPSQARTSLHDWAKKDTTLRPDHFSHVRGYVEQTAVNYDALTDSQTLSNATIDDYFNKVGSDSLWTYFEVDESLETRSPGYVAHTFDNLDEVYGDRWKDTGNLNALNAPAYNTQSERRREWSIYDGGDMYFKAQLRDRHR
jgi:hypothetical protein